MESNIKTVDDAFKYLNLDPSVLPVVSLLPESDRESVISYYKLVVVTRAINKESNGGIEWSPNWVDSNEYKYTPWFDIESDSSKASGFGLSYDDYVSWRTASYVPARLCFKSRDLAIYAGKQFTELYEKYFL